MSNLISEWMSVALGYCLPNACFSCGEPSGRFLICDCCETLLPRVCAESACPCCALPETGGRLCGRCLARPPAFDATRALFEYSFPVVEMVHALKYGSALALSGELGRRLAGIAGENWDAIIPVPVHRRRLRERGFNQALELARPLARQSNIPLWRSVARRIRDTPAQAGLGAKRREQNLRNAFSVSRNLHGMSVLVVDDVMTTGATLNEFARTLKERGAAHVANVVVARTPRAA